MSETKSSWVYYLWLLLCILAAAGMIMCLSDRDRASESTWRPLMDVNECVLPAPSDIQELLNRIEPEPRLTVDGRIGPKTLEKWNRVYMEVSAHQYMK